MCIEVLKYEFEQFEKMISDDEDTTNPEIKSRLKRINAMLRRLVR